MGSILTKPINFEQLQETLYHEKMANGLDVYVLPKQGFNKTYAVFTTKYGTVLCRKHGVCFIKALFRQHIDIKAVCHFFMIQRFLKLFEVYRFSQDAPH